MGGDPFVGMLLLVGFNFAPVGWATCQGQTIAISENDTLFQLIGTTYGGDGQSTFNLPDLQGRTPIHSGSAAGLNYVIGEKAGTENVTLTVQQTPQHNHAALASNQNQSSISPGNNVLAATLNPMYSAGPATHTLNAATLPISGGSQPHNNLQPYLTLNWIISLFGIFPTQN